MPVPIASRSESAPKSRFFDFGKNLDSNIVRGFKNSTQRMVKRPPKKPNFHDFGLFRADSLMEKVSALEARKNLGRLLNTDLTKGSYKSADFWTLISKYLSV